MNKLAELVRQHQSNAPKFSSNQDFSLLDQLLENALIPMEAETDAYYEWLAEVLAFTITSRRRPNDNLVAACINGLCGGTNSVKEVIASGCDRAHMFSLLNNTTKVGETLEESQVDYARRRGTRIPITTLQKIREAKNALGSKPRVGPAMRTSKYWYHLALKQKESILSHYMQLFFKNAMHASVSSGNRIESGPAFHDAYLTAGDAVDRFRADKGVFAHYLGLYLKGSVSESARQALGLAAPGARVASEDALQADAIDGALEIGDPTVGPTDYTVVKRIDAVSRDPDVRAALMLSDITPPHVVQLANHKSSKQSLTLMQSY